MCHHGLGGTELEVAIQRFDRFLTFAIAAIGRYFEAEMGVQFVFKSSLCQGFDQWREDTCLSQEWLPLPEWI